MNNRQIKVGASPGRVFTGFTLLVITFCLVSYLISTPPAIISGSQIGFYVLCYTLLAFLIIGDRFGTFLELREQGIVRSATFWRTRYRYDEIKRVYYYKDWLWGPVLAITYSEAADMEKKVILLSPRLYLESDVRDVVAAIHQKHPLTELDDYCRKLISVGVNEKAA